MTTEERQKRLFELKDVLKYDSEVDRVFTWVERIHIQKERSALFQAKPYVQTLELDKKIEKIINQINHGNHWNN